MIRRPGDLIQKDPSSIEPQGFDWTDWLLELASTVTISTSTWSVSTIAGDAAPVTLSGDAIVTGPAESGSRASSATQVTLTAGTAGYRYTVTNRIITSTNVQDERSFRVLGVQR